MITSLAASARDTGGCVPLPSRLIKCLSRDVDKSHVVQWRLLGAEFFLAMYAGGLEKFGYRNSPLERIAYEAQERFDRSTAVFDAEKFVSDRLSAL